MKTNHIIAALTNSATPAARLAAWQAIPLARGRMVAIRKHAAPGYPCRPCNVPFPATGATHADWRRALIHDPAFTLAPVPSVYVPEKGEPQLFLASLADPAIAREYDPKDNRRMKRTIGHNGGYTDDDFQDETIRPVVIELVRFPGVMFAATVESCSDAVTVWLDTWEAVDFTGCQSDYGATDAREECARDVVRQADSIAQRLAEDEREFQRKDTIEFKITENKETIASLRQEIRALARELKDLCASSMSDLYPVAASAVKAQLSALLGDRRELMEKNAELAASL